MHAGGSLRDKAGPDAGRSGGPEGMRGFVPAVEVSYDLHLEGVGRPHGKARAARALGRDQVRSEFFVSAIIKPL
jgi:hypothetical protein